MAAVFDIELHDTDVQRDDSEDDVIEIGEVIGIVTLLNFCFLTSMCMNYYFLLSFHIPHPHSYYGHDCIS